MKKIIAGNWKMNFCGADATDFSAKLSDYIQANCLEKSEVVIAPPFTSLLNVIAHNSTKILSIAAQNAHWEKSGAYTAEIPASFLKAQGCDYVIIGHSERRNQFGESLAETEKRLWGALQAGLKVFFCIGEKWEQREKNETEQVLTSQLQAIFKPEAQNYLNQIVVAYEPVWAISTGASDRAAKTEDIAKTHAFLAELIKAKLNSYLPLIYGGSVNADNWNEIAQIPNVDGALIGGASIKFEQISKIISITEEL